MKLSVERQKLQMMHQALDRQLQQMNVPVKNSQYMRQSIDSDTSMNENKYKQYSRSSITPPTNEVHRKQQINQLQRKLLELQKKMQCIDIDGSQSDSDTNIKFKQFLRTTKQNYHEECNGKNPEQKKSIEILQKYKKCGIPKNKTKNVINIKIQTSSEEQQQSEEQYNTKKHIVKKMEIQKKQYEEKPIVTIQPMKQQIKSNEDQQINYLQQRYPTKRSRSISKKSQKKQRKLSNNKFSNPVIPISKKKVDLSRQNSQKSFNSQRLSIDKLNKSGNFSIKSFKNDSANKKQQKKISNLQQQLSHYKRLASKLQEKVNELQIIQIEYRKLQKNFAKSQTIRKQQKKLLEKIKNK